jgi:hypothetical protein
MSSFDQSLKLLLQEEPADFIRFALRDRAVQVLEPLPSGLPARGRDVDGGYRALWSGAQIVAHVEFHRRHQSLDDLAVDVAEAQIRFYRRDHLQVLSIVWDLYGREDEPVLEARSLAHGVAVDVGAVGLVALCRGGACEAAVHEARDAIQARTNLTPEQRANHLAVLWFVSEAEDVPVHVMKAYISEKELMASTLYKSIFQKGKAEGEASAYAETLVRLLTRWMGAFDDALQERIRRVTDPGTLLPWLDEALGVDDPKAAQRLAKKIRKQLPV